MMPRNGKMQAVQRFLGRYSKKVLTYTNIEEGKKNMNYNFPSMIAYTCV